MTFLKKTPLLVCTMLVGLSLSSAGYAEKIYMWYTTDEKGKRVPKFGETPPKGVDAKLVSENKPAPSTPASSAEPAAPLTEEQKQMRAKRKQECDAEEQRLKTLESSGSRIRMANPDGTSRYLTPDEILQEIDQSKTFLKSACER